MADKGKGKLIVGMSGGSEDSCTHCSGVTEICQGKINPCFGGGYSVKVLSKCVEACITTLLIGKRVAGSPSSSRPRGPKPEMLEIIKKVRKQIEQYWFLEPTLVDDSILMEKALATSPMAASARGNTFASSLGIRLKRSNPIFKRKEKELVASSSSSGVRLTRSKPRIFKKEKELAASTRGNNSPSSSSRGVRLTRSKTRIFNEKEKELAASTRGNNSTSSLTLR